MFQQKPNQNPTFSSFADWCKNKDSISKEARNTVKALLRYARTSDCYEAERILSSCTEISIYSYRDISDLSPLSTLTNLTTLILCHGRISDLSPLSNLTNLTTLILYGNSLSDLSPLSTLTNLTKLNLTGNQISDLSPLSTLTNLTELYLIKNQICDIRPLSTLTNLTKLDLGLNQICDLSPLSTLINLIALNLSVNQICDLSPLSTLTNLTELNLCNNQISDLNPLLTSTNWIKLALNGNPISGLSIPRSLLDKWHTLSEKPIAPQKAKKAIKSAYAVITKAEPEIIFCNSPYAGLASLDACESLGEPLAEQLSELTSKLLSTGLWYCLCWLIVFQPGENIKQQLSQQLYDDGFYAGSDYIYITPEDLLSEIALTEYCISKLGCVLNPETEEAFHCLNQLFEHCGWIWAYENVCIVCDRPTQLFLDNEHRLHAEGKPAIQFSDGYSLYSYHGVTLPEKYGKIHPNNWQSQWILSEENAELRRVLIQGIGYARICQELAAQELDNWREYTLLKIDNDVDDEPVYLLKMTRNRVWGVGCRV